jgi:hypothetical protein
MWIQGGFQKCFQKGKLDRSSGCYQVPSPPPVLHFASWAYKQHTQVVCLWLPREGGTPPFAVFSWAGKLLQDPLLLPSG